MAVVPIRQRGWRPHPITNFTGGLASPPQTDSEFSVFTNVALTREGYPVTRRGSRLFNTASIGAAQIVGIGRGATGNGQFMVVAKVGTTWYYANIAGTENISAFEDTVAFTSFTVPASPGTDLVTFESVQDAAEKAWMLFCNPTIGVVKWDGTVASAIVGAPNGRYIRLHGSRVYVAGITSKPQTVRYSDTGDAFTWPTTNEYSIPATYGVIQGLERQPGMLIVFTDRAVLGVRGDPPDMVLEVLHDRIGCNQPSSITSVGTSVAFNFHDDVHMLVGGINSISEKVRLVISTEKGDLTQSLFTAITPNYFVFRGAYNSGSGFHLLVLDRARFKAWSLWDYGVTTAVGASKPTFGCVYALNPNTVVMASGDGQLYSQVLDPPSYNVSTGVTTFTKDYTAAGGVDVYSKIDTKVLSFGDPASQKQCRMLMASGEGLHTNLNADYYTAHNDFDPKTTVVFASDKTMPLKYSKPALATPATPSYFNRMLVSLQATNMRLEEMVTVWRPVRLGFRNLT